MSAAIDTQQPRPYATYSADQRLQALALVEVNNGNVAYTARQLGIPQQTLDVWVRDSRFTDVQYREKQAQLSDRFENAAHYYLDLAWDKAPNASFGQLMTGVGIAVDKMQLLRGLPTSITESVERQELTVILESALAAAIDVTPTPDDSTT